MKNLRLLHLVFIASGTLLFFKAAGLISETGFTLNPTLEAFAQDSKPAPARQPSAATSSANADGTPRRAVDATSSPVRHAEPAGKKPAGGMSDGAGPAGEGHRQPNDLGRSHSERAVLERLRDRRRELDARERKQQLREDLLKAAEARIEKRVRELKDLEKQIGVAVDKKKQQEEEDFRDLARMYDSMRAKDAARIFDRLDLPILVKVVRAMKPTKVADALAKMSSDAAQRLTVELATGDSGTEKTTEQDLPKIRGN